MSHPASERIALLLTPRASAPSPGLSRRGRLVGHRARMLGAGLFFLADLAALGGVAVTRTATVPNSQHPWWLVAFLPALVVVLLHARPQPDQRVVSSPFGTAAAVAGAIWRAALVALAACALLQTPHAGQIVAREALITFACLVLWRATSTAILRHAAGPRPCGRPTIIVGAGAVGDTLAARLLANPSYGLRPVGYIDTDPMPAIDRAGHSLPLLGDLDDLGEAIRRTGARQLILAFSSTPDREIVQRLADCDARGLEVSVVPRLYEAINERAAVHLVGGLPVLTMRPTDPRGWRFAVKHILDRAFAALALLALAPLMITIAAAVRLTSAWPVLFRQRRIGRDGHEFTLLKFRTMLKSGSSPEAFEPLPGLAPGGVEGDDRRTAVGRLLRDLSLDELPQLLNVLRGDMSLVGPRPERPEYVRRYALEISRYENRHRVKSGITGWAQVHGLRGQTSIADRVECDNYYIQNWSLRLDLIIALRTIAQLIRPRRVAAAATPVAQRIEL